MTRWHPREHRKALDGMLMLTLEERGAYNTCLDLIYDREGPIPDDARWLSGWMGVSPRKWAKLRASLIIKAKLYEIVLNGEPCLMNQRAAIELENQSKRSRELSENGAKGGRKTGETRTKPNENNVSEQAPVAATLKLLTETYTETEEENPIEPNGSTSPKADPARGSRLPDAWFPKPTAVGDDTPRLPPDQCSVELDKFRDYWRAVPGAKGRKADWDATWRNWLRRAAENHHPRISHDRPHHDAKFEARQANLASAERGFEIAARQRERP